MMNANDIDTMVHHYAIAALWSSTNYTCAIDPTTNCESAGRAIVDYCPTCRYGGQPMDATYGVCDIAEETMKQFTEDCAAFYESCADDLADMSAEQAGHDFWLTRNGHGAGFWDRGLGARGDRLSKMARPFGEVYLYVGDDGKVWGQ